jgi:hypothetical protein
MANLIINERDTERIQQLAQQRNMTAEELVSQMIEKFAIDEQYNSEISVKNYMRKLYKYARKYWTEVNDQARLALTDEQLDEQFWCIDPEGIPRLNEDQDKITLPEDGLLAFLDEIRQQNPTGDVEEPINYREILNTQFPKHLMRYMDEDEYKKGAE